MRPIITLLFRSAIAASALLSFAGSAAAATELTPAEASALLGPRMTADDIADPRVSPDGQHFSFRFDSHLRFDNPPPDDVEAPSCKDVWVARIDGSHARRLSNHCDARGAYGTYGGGGEWTADGAVTGFSAAADTKGSELTYRWTVTVDAFGRDVWGTERRRLDQPRPSTPNLADGLDPTDVDALVGKPAADVITPQLSPDGKRFSFQFNQHLRFDNPVPYDLEAPRCWDTWVARIDGSELRRLSTMCNYRGSFDISGYGGAWAPDGAVTTYSSSGSLKGSGASIRWTVTIGDEGRDHWTARYFDGRELGYTADGRYLVTAHERNISSWAYTAIDLRTGVAHPLWSIGYTGHGEWSADCATAAPVDRTERPTVALFAAVLTGPDAACVFARTARETPTEETPTDEPEPKPTSPLVPISERVDAPPTPPSQPPRLAVSAAPSILAVTTRRSLALGRGFRVAFTANASTATVTVLLAGVKGRASKVLVAGQATVSGDTGAATLLFGRAARKALAKGSKSTVIVRVSAVGPDGRRATIERPVTLTR